MTEQLITEIPVSYTHLDVYKRQFTYYPAAFYRADAGDFVPHVDSARGGLFLLYKAIQEIREEL